MAHAPVTFFPSMLPRGRAVGSESGAAARWIAPRISGAWFESDEMEDERSGPEKSQPPSSEGGAEGGLARLDAVDPSGGAAPDPGGRGYPGFTAIGPYASERAVGEASLVLRSVNVEHRTTWAVGGAYLIVRDADYARARKNLDRYEQENADFPPRRRPERRRYAGPPIVALAFLALVAVAWVTGPVARPHGGWFAHGASVSSLVLSSEPFRAVTALTLHADGAHVLSNLVSGAIFGRAAERRLGPGVALFGIVASGTLGNVANAAFYAASGLEHRSIGASTAVFGAVGLLVASQLVLGSDRTLSPKSGKRHVSEYLAPFVGGVALLGALGSGPETDILAHAFGLIAGVIIGLPLSFAIARWHRSFVWRRPHVLAQAALFALSLGVVGASWAFALV